MKRKIEGFGLLKDRLYINVKYISPYLYHEITKTFTKKVKVFVSPQMCEECYKEGEGEVPCDISKDHCPYKYKTLVMFDKLKLKSGNYLAIWRGNIPLLMKTFKNFIVRDRRVAPKATVNLKFTGTLKDHQKEAVAAWLKAKYGGQIEAPARSGKTVLVVYLTLKLGLKTLILAHQIDLLHQFYSTFEKFTDLANHNAKVPVVAIAEKGNILKLIDQGTSVILSTYQTFISKIGKIRHKKASQAFGLLACDEIHVFGADKASKIITSINAKYRLGVTATPERKDGKDVLAKFAVGEVVSKVNPEQLVGKAVFIFTGTSVGNFTNWVTMLNRIAKNNRRNKIIVNYVINDIKDGHIAILVTERRHQCEDIAKMLKEYNIKTAILYGNVKDRQNLIKDIRLGKYPVTIATRKIVRFGLNIPPWSVYHCLSPTNNKPNFYQEMSRVRTPHTGKKEPLIRYYVDSFNAAMACMRTCEQVLVEQKFEIYREGAADNIVSKQAKKEAMIETAKTIAKWNKFKDIK